jgi:biopolymer transport protein ExbD
LKVQVRADLRTAYGNVARALEVIERAGVQRPYIVTKLVELED